MRALILLLALACSANAGELDGNHPLSVASQDAAIACMAIEAVSIDECGNQIGRSPEFTEARRSITSAHNARAAFMASCKEDLQRCLWMADALIAVGINRAVEPR